MDDPIVDIGIPVYRRATYVATAIESVMAQSYANWSLVISEELGPTDSVLQAVEPYLADARVRYVPVSDRLGVARHKSSLAAQGTGRYLALLDDDDCWDPHWLAARVRFMEANPECGLVWGGHIDIDGDGREIRKVPLPMPEGVHSSRVFVERMMKGNIVATPDVLLRRETYSSAGNLFDHRFLHIDDYELFIRMGLEGPVGFLAVHDAAYRLHDHQYHHRHDRSLDYFHFVDHLDRMLQTTLPQIRLSSSQRRQLKAERLLSAALDAAEAAQPRTAARRILRAAGLAPRALVSRRGLAAVASTLGGRALSRRIGTMRSA
jgi:glycosyltransferase involved in cell wall biosynthesis